MSEKGGVTKETFVMTGRWAGIWKADDRRNVIKAKSRMVARGFGHRSLGDFHSHPVSFECKIVVAIAHEKDWMLRHLVVKKALI